MNQAGRKVEPETILIISNDNDVIQDITQVFAICMPNTIVKTSKKARNTHQVLNALQPELIILDLNGNHVDSFDVLSKIRHESDVPLITMSYSRDRALLIRALELEADRHITKPFNHLEFVAQVKACLRRSQARFEHLGRK